MDLDEEYLPPNSDEESEPDDDPDDNEDAEFANDRVDDEIDAEEDAEEDESDEEDAEPTRGRRTAPRRQRAVLGRDNRTEWFRRPPANLAPPRIILRIARSAGVAAGLTDPASLLKLLINEEIIDIMLRYTNAVIMANRGARPTMQPYETRILTADELYAFLGLLIMTAALKNSRLRTQEIFSTTTGAPIFSNTMSVNRFKHLLRFLRFDDKETAEERRRLRKFALFEEVWQMFCTNCQKNYHPSTYMTVDETILGFRGNCGFKIYQPQKPDKYGLKIVTLCDAGNSYFFNGVPYTGPVPRVRGSLMIPTQEAIKLTTPIHGSERTITADNYFTSTELATEMLQRNLTLIGTVRRNRSEIPQRMLEARRRDLMKSKFLYQEDRMILSFVPRPRKIVIILSTAHLEDDEIDEETGKPRLILQYNRTKGGVDTMNQIIRTRTCKRKTRRWTLRYMFGVIDMACHNAFILHKQNGGNMTRFKFLKEIAENLTEPYMRQRLDDPRITKKLKASIKIFLNLPPEEEAEVPQQPLGRPPGRCYICPRRADRRAATYCTKCKRGVCGLHRRYVCTNCYRRD